MTLITRIYEQNAMAGMKFETYLFNLANQSIEAYNGGLWEALGEHIVCIPEATQVRLQNNDNQCDLFTDMRSATVAVCIMSLNHMLWTTPDKAGVYDFFEKEWKRAMEHMMGDNSLDRHAINRFLD